MVRRAGIEPATLGLKGPCSTTELPTHAPCLPADRAQVISFFYGWQ